MSLNPKVITCNKSPQMPPPNQTRCRDLSDNVWVYESYFFRQKEKFPDNGTNKRWKVNCLFCWFSHIRRYSSSRRFLLVRCMHGIEFAFLWRRVIENLEAGFPCHLTFNRCSKKPRKNFMSSLKGNRWNSGRSQGFLLRFFGKRVARLLSSRAEFCDFQMDI